MIKDFYGNLNIAVKRATTARSSSGGTTKTWATEMTINGLIEPLTAEEMLVNERLGDKSTHRLFTDVVDIRATDQIYDTVNEVTYKINGSPINPGNRNHHLETKLERIV